MESNSHQYKMLLIAAYAALYIIWGSTYLAIRFCVETITPIFSAGIRFTFAGLLLVGARLLISRKMPPLKAWLKALFTSICPFVINYGLITSAETIVPSSITALLVAIEPLLFCLIGWLFFGGKKPLINHYIGIAVGFIGIAFLVIGDPNAQFSFESKYTVGMMMVIFACTTWVIGAFISAKAKIYSDPLMSSGMQMLCAGIIMFILQFGYSAVTGNYPSLDNISTKSILALAYLIIFGSIIAYSAFLWLMIVEPANRVSTHTFVNPLIAVFLGWIMGGEEIHMNVIIAIPFIVGSVVLMIYEKKTKN